MKNSKDSKKPSYKTMKAEELRGVSFKKYLKRGSITAVAKETEKTVGYVSQVANGDQFNKEVVEALIARTVEPDHINVPDFIVDDLNKG